MKRIVKEMPKNVEDKYNVAIDEFCKEWMKSMQDEYGSVPDYAWFVEDVEFGVDDGQFDYPNDMYEACNYGYSREDLDNDFIEYAKKNYDRIAKCL